MTHPSPALVVNREDFTRAEAEQFVKEAIALAMTRDASSGGTIRLVTLDGPTVTHTYVSGDKVPQFHDDLPFPAPGSVGLPPGFRGAAGGQPTGMVLG